MEPLAFRDDICEDLKMSNLSVYTVSLWRFAKSTEICEDTNETDDFKSHEDMSLLDGLPFR